MMRKYTNRATKVFAAVLLGVLALGSCNKGVQDTLNVNGEVWKDTLNIGTDDYKVLYLIVDGLNGNMYKDINGHYINDLAKNAIYSWNGLSDYRTDTLEQATAWANMMTGVMPALHGVKADSFADNALSQYPTFITHLKERDASIKAATFSVSESFDVNLSSGADLNELLASDAEVKDAIIEQLKVKDIDVVLGQMNGPKLAGDANDYASTTLAYSDAVLLIDSYFGEIITALKQRPSFDYEKWLVVIASSSGDATGKSTYDGVSAFNDPARNTFVMFYNPRFIANAIPKPEVGNPFYRGTAIRYDLNDGAGVATIQGGGNEFFNFGTEGDYTVAFKVKIPDGNYYYPTVLSKRTAFANGQVGWCVFLEAKKWQVNIGRNGQPNIQASGADISDGQWHNITFVIDQEGASRVLRTYTDGVFNTELDITGVPLNSDAPLTIGGIDGGHANVNLLLTDLKVFSAALPETIIQRFGPRVQTDESHPFYSKLIGYWPGLDNAMGETIADMSANNNDFVLQDDYVWEVFADEAELLKPAVPASVYQNVPLGVDIPAQIFQWFGIYQIPQEWQIAGKARRYDYEDVNGR